VPVYEECKIDKYVSCTPSKTQPTRNERKARKRLDQRAENSAATACRI